MKKIKLAVAGSRSLNKPAVSYLVTETLSNILRIGEIVSDCATGPSKFAEDWAEWTRIPVTKFKADWERFKSVAGYVRNDDLVKYADALVAFWDYESAGTGDIITIGTERRRRLLVSLFHSRDAVAGQEGRGGGLTQKSAAPARRPLDCRVMPETTTENGNERTED